MTPGSNSSWKLAVRCSITPFVNAICPPYADNPFRTIEVCRIPIEDAKLVTPFSAEQEVELLRACDDWQFPIFLTLLLTGLRPGELVHLLLPDDVDLENGWLRVRDKPKLGWQVKTRNERDIPLLPVLCEVLRSVVAGRATGPLFMQRRCFAGHQPPLAGRSGKSLDQEVTRRTLAQEMTQLTPLSRSDRQEVTAKVWRDLGTLQQDWIRIDFMRLTSAMGMPEITAPKTLRHLDRLGKFANRFYEGLALHEPQFDGLKVDLENFTKGIRTGESVAVAKAEKQLVALEEEYRRYTINWVKATEMQQSITDCRIPHDDRK